MKRNGYIFLIVALTGMSTWIFSQTSPPQLLSYQGIARDASGNILANQPIGIQLIIHQGTASGTSVFTEVHSVTTNSLGLFTLQIGSNNSSSFQSIDWSQGPYFLEVQMDPTGGSSYVPIGTQQLLSVPYALYAEKSYSATSSYSAAYAVASYTTINLPPITINTNTSSTSTTLTITQGTNSASATINFPPPPPSNVTLTPSGIANITPTVGNTFTINVPPPTLTVVPGANNATISITQGTSTASDVINFPAGTINGTATGIATSTVTGNNFTINVPPPAINVQPGTNNATISITQGTFVTSDTIGFPSTTHTITGTGIAVVSPTAGNNFTVNVPSQTLSITGNGITQSYSLNSTHGGTVALPIPSISINLPHNIIVSPGGYNFALNVLSPNLLPTSASTNNVASITSTPTSLTYSIAVPPASLSAITNTAGVTTLSLTHGPLTTTASIDANSIKAWSLSGNMVTPSDYLGTNNAANLIFKTNNTERMRISSSGDVGIGNISPSAKLHVSTTSSTNINTFIDKGYLRYQPQGSVTYTPGNVVINSNTNGDLIYGNSPTLTTFTSINNVSVSSISTTPLPLGIGPGNQRIFNKQYDNSVVEIDLYALISGTVSATFSSNLQVWFDIDGGTMPITGNYSSSVFRVQSLPLLGSPFEYFAHVKCYYYGASGTHTLRVMCMVGTGNITNVQLDSGGYGGLIFVKENF